MHYIRNNLVYAEYAKSVSFNVGEIKTVFNKLRVITVAATLVTLAVPSLSRVQTASALIGPESAAFSCTEFGFSPSSTTIELDRDNTGIGQEHFAFEIRDGQGTLLYGNNGNYQFPVGLSFDVGNATYSYTPLPQYNPITLTIISFAGNGLAEQVVFTASGNCPGLPVFVPSPGLPGGVPGPQIPDGFVLRTVTCNTGLYWSPDINNTVKTGGLTAGQTWYVNPKSVTRKDSRAWTEVFVSGNQTIYVPAECVA